MQRNWSVGNTGITVSLNIPKKGVEVRFDVRPSREKLEELKATQLKNFKWSRFSRCWYAKLTQGNLDKANSIAGTAIPLPSAITEREAWLIDDMTALGYSTDDYKVGDFGIDGSETREQIAAWAKDYVRS